MHLFGPRGKRIIETRGVGFYFRRILSAIGRGRPRARLGNALSLNGLINFSFLRNRSTLTVIAAYLDAFQKIADAATNAKGTATTSPLALYRLFHCRTVRRRCRRALQAI